MAENSKIEWTHHTFNPWRGCTKVSEGCRHCYAETLSGRNPKVLGVWGPSGSRVVASESYWREPLKWDKKAAAAGERHRVFCASLADVFEARDTMPDEAWSPVMAARARLLKLITSTPNLDWLLLTKRPGNVEPVLDEASDHIDHYESDSIATAWGRRVWLGTSIENQGAAEKRHAALMAFPAAVRFWSAEPLVGPVDALPLWEKYGKPDWVIVGGESGPWSRPMHTLWARVLRDQCVAAGVAFHFKQWGEWCPGGQAGSFSGDGIELRDIDFDGSVLTGSGRESKDGRWVACYRVGKKAAGRVIDGRTWDELPAAGVISGSGTVETCQ